MRRIGTVHFGSVLGMEVRTMLRSAATAAECPRGDPACSRIRAVPTPEAPPLAKGRPAREATGGEPRCLAALALDSTAALTSLDLGGKRRVFIVFPLSVLAIDGLGDAEGANARSICYLLRLTDPLLRRSLNAVAGRPGLRVKIALVTS